MAACSWSPWSPPMGYGSGSRTPPAPGRRGHRSVERPRARSGTRRWRWMLKDGSSCCSVARWMRAFIGSIRQRRMAVSGRARRCLPTIANRDRHRGRPTTVRPSSSAACSTTDRARRPRPSMPGRRGLLDRPAPRPHPVRRLGRPLVAALGLQPGRLTAWGKSPSRRRRSATFRAAGRANSFESMIRDTRRDP
jgi:hypothetical protein